jgi:hypothetical protein
MPRKFLLRLTFFFAPLLAVYGIPLFVLLSSRELFSVRTIASWHADNAHVDAVYGPAYSNPDRGYKFVSAELHHAPVLALGTSRVMQFRREFFNNGSTQFYNAGGVVGSLWDYRTFLDRYGDQGTKYLIVGLDQWNFNQGWGDNHPSEGLGQDYDCDYQALDTLQRSLDVYSDLRAGKMTLSQFLSPGENLGASAIASGDGFRSDGSYLYARELAHPEKSADYQFKDTLERVRTGTRRFEFGDISYQMTFVELGRFLDDAATKGYAVTVFLPPFAPSVLRAMKADGRHRYLDAIGSGLFGVCQKRGIACFDFTDCGGVDCTDQEFVDGFHGNDAVYARLLLRMSSEVGWLAPLVDSAALELNGGGKARN